jgi:ADP-heptose:LPS heptosyltransferase
MGKRIIIIRSGALGDLVYSTAIIDALHSQFGEGTLIDYICTPGSAKLFEKDTRINNIFLLKHRKIPIIFSKQKQAIIKYSKKNPYDILINFETGKQFSSLAKKIHATKKIGTPYTKITKYIPGQHKVESLKYLYEEIIDKEILDTSMPRVIGEQKEIILKKYKLPEKYIVINPSNSHAKNQKINYRAWPQEHWKELINSIDQETTIVIIAGKGEDDYFKDITPFPTNCIDLIGKTPLVDLITVIENAQAIITTDTGPAHLASAVNTPTIVLIGPTPAERTGPYQTEKNTIYTLSVNLECSPCYRTPVMYACTDNQCMKQITPELVNTTLKECLAN